MSEEQARKLMQNMQMLEAYFAELSKREAELVRFLNEATAASDSIKSLKLKPESETLLPIGLGIYLPTKVSSDKKVSVNVGAGVVLEKNLESAQSYVESHIKGIEISLQDNAAKKHNAQQQLEQGRLQINQLMQSIQSKPGK